MSPRILVVDDDRAFRLSTAELLRDDGHTVELAASASEAVDLLDAGPFDLILLDLRMPGLDGLGLVEVLRKRGHRLPILMISGFGTIDAAVDALHLGADDFLTKPVEPEALSRAVAELVERRPTPGRLWEGTFRGMVGTTSAMREVFDAVRQAGPTDATVLVTGETGTGKELVARAVHDVSRRASGPFVAVNCAALAEGVLESELFGHVKGAFTGAVQAREGLFDAADGGTIFLDEVGDLGLHLQQRLLRVIQEREVLPVGATRPHAVDVRVVAATHRELTEEVEAGHFREDLFYRLKVFPIRLPPLRERKADIPLLIQAGLDRLRARSPEGVPEACSPPALRLLVDHPWRGNVRELFAVIESSAIRASGDRIEVQDLPQELADRREDSGEERYEGPPDPREERAAIVAALQSAGGVRKRAAEILGMSRTTLWRKMKEFDLEMDGD